MTTVTVDNRVKQIVSNIRNLPTPPIVFHQIQKVINDPRTSAGQIASILSEDPAMSVKVLKLTNSAFYGLTREVDSVKQAVVIVGLEAIKNLVLSASVLDMFKGKNIDQEFEEKFWRHSLATAFCCRLMARKVQGNAMVDPDAAFSAGLLHDIGKIILCAFLPEEYRRFKEVRVTDNQSETYKVEEQVLGYTHCQIGSLLAVQWKLPSRLGEAITYHHHPAESPAPEPLIHTVHLANYIAKKTFYDRDEAHLVGGWDQSTLQVLGVGIEDLEGFSQALREEYVKAETFMKMAGIS
ncbi:MAG: HDOD domain-containing protein [Candidatus Zixiibacteriota bacterium]